MNRILPLWLVFGLTAATLSCPGEDYSGKVGELAAVFSLDWHADGRVTGSYSHPSRPGVTYSLEGSNPAEGQLHLEEYTGKRLTARCHLKKSVEGGAIVWRGRMENLDGRSFPMEFARVRKAAPGESPAPAAAAGGTPYVGYVGRLEAEFTLFWQDDGTVSGSYHYPKRAGTTYTLTGNNPREGELYLAEYTGQVLTARCLLKKRLEEGKIVWEGMMTNTDGRRFPIAFWRQRETGAPSSGLDKYEARRRALLQAMAPEVRWDTFPRADEPVEMVPIHLEDGEYFGARIEEVRIGPASTELVLGVGDWDLDGDFQLEAARPLVVHAARRLPLPPDRLIGSEVSLLLDSQGSLFSLELADVAVTHARRHASGKYEVRGILDFYHRGPRPEFGTPEYTEEMRRAPVAEFLPDKFSLNHDPEGAFDPTLDDYGFQVIRLVREFGICIQSTAAGPGSVELESISLDPGESWILLKDARSPIRIPATQSTGQAG